MAISPVLTTAVSGLNANAQKANVAANNIANVQTAGYEAQSVSFTTVVSGGGLSSGTAVSAQLIGTGQDVDLGTEIVRLREADITYRANAAVIRTAEELADETLRLKA